MLVIAFMVLIGAISTAVLSTATSGVQRRVVLDVARDRQYAADAAIESTIAAARGLSPSLIGTCPPPPATPFVYNNDSVHVDCQSVPAVVVVDGVTKLQKNLSFVACLAVGSGYGSACTPSNTVITAQVNFKVSGTAVSTWVQSWSVNG
jgi:hypothetical protein